MAKFTTITKKKDDENDERTMNASEFVNRVFGAQNTKEQLPEVDNTELPIK